MARSKRGYVREVIKKRDYHLFAIACDGSVRERNYFERFEELSSRITVDLINDVTEDGEMVVSSNSSPNHVIERANQYVKTAGLIEGDEVWLVLDVDNWPESQLSMLCQEAMSRSWKVAISNPCFEVWLCYHVVSQIDDDGRTLKSAEVKRYLSTITKDRYKDSDYAPLVFKAAEIARVIDKHRDYRIPEYKETQLYRLIDAMRAYSSETEIAVFCKSK